jgi:DNA primase
MARVPQEEIDRIKAEVRVEDLVRASGVELKRHGADNLMGLCPHHSDRNASLVVSPAKNLWNCLGACQQGGDVIAWVMRAEGCSFVEAVERLRGEGGGPRGEEGEREGCPITLEMSDAEMLEAVIGYYQRRLHVQEKPAGEARRMMERRGIWSEEAIGRFRIGFADRTLGNLLPGPELKAGKLMRQRLAALGIYRADTGREHFNGCVVFPVIGSDGAVAEIYGRKIRDDVRHRVGRHLYLPGPHRGIWNGEALRESREIIVCESIIDALTFWIHGYRSVITAFGVNGFTAEMFEAVQACAIERVLIAYDRDEGGDKAAVQLGQKLAEVGISSYRVLFPRMMDANDYAKKVAPAAQSLGVLLRSAEWMAGEKRRAASDERRVAEKSAEAALPGISEVTGGEEMALPGSSLAAHRSSLAAPPVVRLAEPERIDEALSSLAASLVENLDNVASPTPLAPRPSPLDPPPDFTDVTITLGDRDYRIRGLEKNLSYSQLKVVIRAVRGDLFYVDQVDLIVARARAQFVRQAAADLGVKEEVIKYDLAAVYRELERLQELLIKGEMQQKPTAPPMSEREQRDAMELLSDPKLLERLLTDYERAGVVGERTNKLMAYLAATSRLLDDPLAIVIQSSSAAGKTTLMDAVLSFIPPEERVRYSAMTGQSLFYFESSNLKHKILAISEEEGAERATYALKLLQSEGELTIASTGKDPQTGRLTTQEYHVEGPVMIILTTTAIEIDEELMNRCIVLTVDEERAQTRAIHQLQRRRETLEGLLAREERDSILRLHQNAQRLLRPLRVVNNLAESLTFLDSQTRTRRDHMKYLTLIRTIALVHQHQRPRRTTTTRDGRAIEYIEVTEADISLANELANEVLGRSLDELPPQTRRLLEIVDRRVDAECKLRRLQRCDFRFSQKTVREWSGWTDYQVKVHLRKLVELEYLLIHRGGRGQSFVYELLYDGGGKDGRAFVMGLLSANAANREHPEGDREHQKGEWEESGSMEGGAGEHRGSNGQNGLNSSSEKPLGKLRNYQLKNTSAESNGSSHANTSYTVPAEPELVAAAGPGLPDA